VAACLEKNMAALSHASQEQGKGGWDVIGLAGKREGVRVTNRDDVAQCRNELSVEHITIDKRIAG
jgi:hypothetical protein